jgi:hypothetical protein
VGMGVQEETHNLRTSAKLRGKNRRRRRAVDLQVDLDMIYGKERTMAMVRASWKTRGRTGHGAGAVRVDRSVAGG